MESPLFLVIDQGTQSTRALVFDQQGSLVYRVQEKIEPYYSRQPGWAEQDADYFWQALCRVCKTLVGKAGDDINRIHSMSVTTQRGSMVNLDAQGQVLRPVILWLDQRIASEFQRLPWYWRLAFRMLGLSETIHYFQQKATSNWIKQHETDIWKKTDKYLLLSGYLTYQLTGTIKDSIGSVVGYLPFNYRKQGWSDFWDWKWHVVPVKKSQLPELVPPGQMLGRLTADASRETGLPEGLKIIASASDKACEVLGSGGISADIACISFGTTATININQKRYREPMRFIPSFPSAIPGEYNAEIMIYRGFWMVSWFRDHFGFPEVSLAEQQNKEPEQFFDDLINQVEPGSDGLLLQPYWSPGLKNLEARGSIIGFSDHHSRAHFYRAILEGIVYALRDGREVLERRNGHRIRHIVVSGGGSQSDAAMQICADVFGMPVTRPHTFETSGLGSAIQQAVANGIYCDYQSACKHMVHTGSEFRPIKKNTERYDWIYQNLYQHLYRRLKPLYRRLFLQDRVIKS